MEERELRERAQEHADAIVRGDMDTAMADFAPEGLPTASWVPARMPQPVTSAEIVRAETHEDHGVAEIAYAGNDDALLTIRSRWEPRDDRLLIVSVEPGDSA